MDTQTYDQIEKRLRSNWDSLWPNILERFSTVTKSDLDSATSAEDLVERIADKSDFTPNYVEGQVAELCGVGAGDQGAQRRSNRPGVPFGHQHGSNND